MLIKSLNTVSCKSVTETMDLNIFNITDIICIYLHTVM